MKLFASHRFASHRFASRPFACQLPAHRQFTGLRHAIDSFTGRPAAFLLFALLLSTASFAQLKPKTKCPDFTVDILNGTLNGLKPDRTEEEFKTTLPCYTSVEEEGTNAKCGSGVFFKDKDVFVYTKRRYIAIGPRFTGKISIPVMGSKRNSLFKYLGNPKLKDDLWDAYEMQYGTLVLHYDVAGAAGKVKLIQFSTQGSDLLELCE